MGKPHKHAEIIKAWADGAEIEFYDTRFVEQGWKTCGNPPVWDEAMDYRIKLHDRIVYPHNVTYRGDNGYGRTILVEGQLKLTIDGETGTLKSAEVLK